MSYQSAFIEILAETKAEIRLSYMRRRLNYATIARKAVVLKGARRSGKSTMLRQIEDDERASGRICLAVNFVDERLSGLAAADLASMFDALHQVENVPTDAQLSLLLDELQVVDGWEAFVERQLRIPGRRVYITGSSSKLFSSEIATSMRGRSLSYEIFPFDFSEFLELQGLLPKSVALGGEAKAAVKAQFQRYLLEGGYPETIGLDRRTQVQILQEYFDVLLLRDVIERHNASSPVLVKRFLLQLIQRYSSSFSINRFVDLLRAQGLGAGKAHITEMIEWFLDAYAVFPVTVLSESLHKQHTNPKKLYAIDNGLINAVTTGRLQNEGRLLENLVFLTLRRRGDTIHYVKTRSGYEVDFYTPTEGLIQVAWSIEDTATRQRELRALEQAMEELGASEALLITANESEEILGPVGRIKIVPAWEWCLLYE